MCSPEACCCVECHFAFEEKHCLPYLPPHLQRQLLIEHGQLCAMGQPEHLVEDHARREMEWFRAYVPPEVVAQVEKDHQKYGEGNLPRQPPERRAVSVGAERKESTMTESSIGYFTPPGTDANPVCVGAAGRAGAGGGGSAFPGGSGGSPGPRFTGRPVAGPRFTGRRPVPGPGFSGRPVVPPSTRLPTPDDLRRAGFPPGSFPDPLNICGGVKASEGYICGYWHMPPPYKKVPICCPFIRSGDGSGAKVAAGSAAPTRANPSSLTPGPCATVKDQGPAPGCQTIPWQHWPFTACWCHSPGGGGGGKKDFPLASGLESQSLVPLPPGRALAPSSAAPTRVNPCSTCDTSDPFVGKFCKAAGVPDGHAKTCCSPGAGISPLCVTYWSGRSGKPKPPIQSAIQSAGSARFQNPCAPGWESAAGRCIPPAAPQNPCAPGYEMLMGKCVPAGPAQPNPNGAPVATVPGVTASFYDAPDVGVPYYGEGEKQLYCMGQYTGPGWFRGVCASYDQYGNPSMWWLRPGQSPVNTPVPPQNQFASAPGATPRMLQAPGIPPGSSAR